MLLSASICVSRPSQPPIFYCHMRKRDESLVSDFLKSHKSSSKLTRIYHSMVNKFEFGGLPKMWSLKGLKNLFRLNCLVSFELRNYSIYHLPYACTGENIDTALCSSLCVHCLQHNLGFLCLQKRKVEEIHKRSMMR